MHLDTNTHQDEHKAPRTHLSWLQRGTAMPADADKRTVQRISFLQLHLQIMRIMQPVNNSKSEPFFSLKKEEEEQCHFYQKSIGNTFSSFDFT